MLKLRINPLATEDLKEIKEYISREFDKPQAAIRVVRNIIDSYEKLKDFPMIGSKLSEKVDIKTDFRFLISGNYIVFYKVDDVFVSIYRILYAERDYLNILFPKR